MCERVHHSGMEAVLHAPRGTVSVGSVVETGELDIEATHVCGFSTTCVRVGVQLNAGCDCAGCCFRCKPSACLSQQRATLLCTKVQPPPLMMMVVRLTLQHCTATRPCEAQARQLSTLLVCTVCCTAMSKVGSCRSADTNLLLLLSVPRLLQEMRQYWV